MRCIAKKCNLENKTEIYIITDGKPALIATCLKSLVNVYCIRHFEANCKDFLIGMGIKRNMKDAILDVFFSQHGLVEAKNKQDLNLKAPIPQNGQTHSNNSSANCRQIV